MRDSKKICGPLTEMSAMKLHHGRVSTQSSFWRKINVRLEKGCEIKECRSDFDTGSRVKNGTKDKKNKNILGKKSKNHSGREQGCSEMS